MDEPNSPASYPPMEQVPETSIDTLERVVRSLYSGKRSCVKGKGGVMDTISGRISVNFIGS